MSGELENGTTSKNRDSRLYKIIIIINFVCLGEADGVDPPVGGKTQI